MFKSFFLCVRIQTMFAVCVNRIPSMWVFLFFLKVFHVKVLQKISIARRESFDICATYREARPTRPKSRRPALPPHSRRCLAMGRCSVDQLCSPLCSKTSCGRGMCGRSWNLCRNLCNIESRLVIWRAAWCFGLHQQLANECAEPRWAKWFSAARDDSSAVLYVIVASWLATLATTIPASPRSQLWWCFPGWAMARQSLLPLRFPSPHLRAMHLRAQFLWQFCGRTNQLVDVTA